MAATKHSALVCDRATVPIVNEQGEEWLAEEQCRCEYCNGPIGKDGETTAYVSRDTEEAVKRLAQSLWDSPQTAFVAISTVILRQTGQDIAKRFQHLTGREVTRQDIYHHRQRAAKIWPALAGLLRINAGVAKNRNRRYCLQQRS